MQGREIRIDIQEKGWVGRKQMKEGGRNEDGRV